MKKILSLLAVMFMTVFSTAWAVTDSKIVFTTTIEPGSFPSDAAFTDGDLTLDFPGGNDKFSIDQPTNLTRFGDVGGYESYTMRLKSGAKSDGTANYMHLSLSEYTEGVLRLAVRSANSSEARTLIVADQWGDVIYNEYVSAVRVTEGETEVSVYPYVDIPFYGSELTIYYPDGGLNFYSLQVLPFRTCQQANVEALEPNKVFPLHAFYVVYSKEGYTYICDENGYCTLLYGMKEPFNYSLNYAGMMVRTSPYQGLPELRAITPVSKLKGDNYSFDAYTRFNTDAPSQDNLNQYMVYRDVTFSEAVSFSSASNKTTIVGTWRGQPINFFNALRIDADLDPTKSYDIVAFSAVFKSTYQVYPAEITEHINYEPTNLQVFTATDNKVTLTWDVEVFAYTYRVTLYFENGESSSFYTSKNSLERYADYGDQQIRWSVQAMDNDYNPVSEIVYSDTPFVWPKHQFYMGNMQADVAKDGTCTFSWETNVPRWRLYVYDENGNSILSVTGSENSSYTCMIPKSGKYFWYLAALDKDWDIIGYTAEYSFTAEIFVLENVTVTIDNSSDISTDNGLYLWWWTPGQNGQLTPLQLTSNGQYVATISPETSCYSVLVVNQNVYESGWDYASQTYNSREQTGDAHLTVYNPESGDNYYGLYDADYLPINIQTMVDADGVVVVSWDAVKDAAGYSIVLFQNGYDRDYYSSNEKSVRLVSQYSSYDQSYIIGVRALDAEWYYISPWVKTEEEVLVPGVTHSIENIRTSVSAGECTISWQGDVDNYLVEVYNNADGRVIYSTTVYGAEYCTYSFDSDGRYYCSISALNADGEVVYKNYSSTFYVNVADGGPDYTPTNLKATVDNGKVSFSWEASLPAPMYRVRIYRQSSSGLLASYDNVVGTSLTVTSTFSEEEYVYWTVEATDGNSPISEAALGASFTMPADPRYLRNLQVVPSEEGYQFTWEGTYAYYRVGIYSSDADFDGYYSDFMSETSLTYVLSAPGTYYWYVDAYDQDFNYVTDRWGQQLTVIRTIGENEYTPTNLNVEVNAAGDATFSWEAKEAADEYQISIYYLDGSLYGTYETTNANSFTRYSPFSENRELYWSIVAINNDKPATDEVLGSTFEWLANNHYLRNLQATSQEEGYLFTWEGNYDYYTLYIENQTTNNVTQFTFQTDTFRMVALDEPGEYIWYVNAYDKNYSYQVYDYNWITITDPNLGDVDIVIYNRSDMTINDHELYVWYWTDSEGGLAPLSYDSEKDCYSGSITVANPSVGVLVVNQDVLLDGWVGSEQTTDYMVENNQVVLVVANPTEETDGKYLLREPDYTPTNLTVVSEDGSADFSWDAEVPAPYYKLYNYNADGTLDYWWFTELKKLNLVTSITEDIDYTWGVQAYSEDGPLSDIVYGDLYTFRGNPHYIKNETVTQVSDSTYSFSWEGDVELYQLVIYYSDNRTVYDYVKVADTTCTYTFTESGDYYWSVFGVDSEGNALSYSGSEYLYVSISEPEPEPEPTYYMLSITAGAGGQVSADKANGTYEEGTVVSVTATPDAGYQFDTWSDGVTTATRTLTLTSDTTLVATFKVIPPSELATYKLTLSCGDNGSITPAPGVHEYKEGDKVTLTATPDAGYQFDTWSDGVTTATRTLTLTSDTTLVATFKVIPPSELATYKLTLSCGDNGSITPAPGVHEYKEGDKVTLTATPDAGYVFNRWSDGVSAATRTITMTSDTTLEATFKKYVKPTTYYLEITAGIGGSVNDEVNGSYTYGTEVEIIATPNKGYRFDKWSDGDKHARRTLTIEGEPITLEASFIKTYTLSLESGIGGSVNDEINGTYDKNTELEIRAIAAPGYQFVQWSDDVTDSVRTIKMTSDITLKAEFQKVYTLQITAGEGGTVNEDVSGIYAEATEVTIIATPDEGYKFVGWSDGNTEAERKIRLTENITLMAEFELEQDEAVQNVNDDVCVTKRIVDGHLLIQRDGKTYNLQGTMVNL